MFIIVYFFSHENSIMITTRCKGASGYKHDFLHSDDDDVEGVRNLLAEATQKLNAYTYTRKWAKKISFFFGPFSPFFFVSKISLFLSRFFHPFFL